MKRFVAIESMRKHLHDMKSPLHILVACVLITNTQAQTIHFSDSSNVWNFSYFSSGILPPITSAYTNYYLSDTLIGGLKYRKLWYGSSSNFAYIREDTTSKKVFAIFPFYSTDTAEKLLYDYTLSIGDTFRTLPNKYVVFSIDSVLVGTAWHKVWHLHHCGPFPFDQSYIEGIGSINSPLETLTPNPVYFEGGNLLLCFQNNGVAPPIIPAFGPYMWDGSSSIFYFDNTTSCDHPILEVPLPDFQTMEITPNPAQRRITIRAPYLLTSISIYDMMGHLMNSVLSHTLTESIDIEDYPPGVYIIRINSTAVRRFVKQ